MQNNTPKLRFKEFTDEWQEKKLGDITKINQGLQIAISKRHTSKVPNSYFYITNEFIKYGAKKQYFIANPPQSVICSPEDILMTRTGNTGKVLTGISGTFHNNFFRIKYDKDISKNFLFYFLNLRKTQNLILRLAGTSTIPDLNHKDFYRIPIVLPTTTEQQKIADFLTSVDERIGKLEKKKGLFEKYKKGVMQNLFPTKGETNPKIRFRLAPNSNYSDWEEKKLMEVLKIGSGRGYKHLSIGNIPVFGTGGHMLSVNKSLYDGESVFIGRKGTIDKPFYFNGKFWTVDTLFYTHDFNGIIPKFTGYIFQLINWLKYNEASGVPSLSKTTIEKIKVRLPSLQEQKKIADFLTSLDNKVDLINKKLEQAKEFKKGLLQKMFA